MPYRARPGLQPPCEVELVRSGHAKVPQLAVGVDASELSKACEVAHEECRSSCHQQALRNRPRHRDTVDRRRRAAKLVDEHQARARSIAQDVRGFLDRSEASGRQICEQWLIRQAARI